MELDKDIFGRMIAFSKQTKNLNYAYHKQYFPLPLRISRCRRISSQEKMVLIELFCCFGQNEVAFPSLETIAFRLDIDDKTVSKSIKKLVDKQFISVYKAPNRVNRYYLGLLETNPYITLSELTHWYERNIQTRRIPKSDIINEIRWEIKRVTDGTMYDSCLERLTAIVVELEEKGVAITKDPNYIWAKGQYMNLCKQERALYDDYIGYLNTLIHDKFGDKVRTVQPLDTI